MGWPIGLLIDASKGYPTDNNIPGTLICTKYHYWRLQYAGEICTQVLLHLPGQPMHLYWIGSISTTNGNTILTTNDDVKLNGAIQLFKS